MSNDTLAHARQVAVLADCHVHAGGPDWTAATLDALSDADLIVTLGDMGESKGLDRLAQIAPVIGVRGVDDEDDPRTAPAVRTLILGGVPVGLVFDPAHHGLAESADPFMPHAQWLARARELFGQPIQWLLFASTHRPHRSQADGVGLLNPGSALLPAEGSRPSFARLMVGDGRVDAEVVVLAP